MGQEVTWSVAFPEMRREVSIALAHLADLEYQQRVWRDGEFPGVSRYYSWDMTLHALYDDASLGDGAESAIGDLFHDEVEAAGIDAVIAALEAVLTELGDADAPERDVLRTEGWPAVVDAARRAATLLAR